MNMMAELKLLHDTCRLAISNQPDVTKNYIIMSKNMKLFHVDSSVIFCRTYSGYPLCIIATDQVSVKIMKENSDGFI